MGGGGAAAGTGRRARHEEGRRRVSLLWDEPAEGMGDLSNSSRRQWVIWRQLGWVRGPGDSCFKETRVSLFLGPTTAPGTNTKPEVPCPMSPGVLELGRPFFQYPGPVTSPALLGSRTFSGKAGLTRLLSGYLDPTSVIRSNFQLLI